MRRFLDVLHDNNHLVFLIQSLAGNALEALDRDVNHQNVLEAYVAALGPLDVALQKLEVIFFAFFRF